MPTQTPTPERCHAILLAFVDYMITQHSDKALLVNGRNSMAEHFEHVRNQAELFYNSGDTKKLERLFLKTTAELLRRLGKEFEKYARSTTLPDFSMDEIPEWEDPNVFVKRRVTDLGNGITTEEVSIINYVNDPGLVNESSPGGHGEVASPAYDADAFSLDDHYSKDILEVASPDGKYIARLRESGYKDIITTYIDLSWHTGTGALGAGCGLYSTPGRHHKINIRWKDEHTLVVESSRGLTNHHIHIEHVQCGDDLVVIEHVEI
ncbi:MAG: hypothetical protein JO301_14565 [Chitinophagaceae bacterium]|nr:hypothetical protein [Chitinophagaceae bacterium]